MEQIATVGLSIASIYLILGIFFAIAFLWKGVTKIDEGAVGTGIGFKLLILPGTILLWIPLLLKWLRTSKN